MRKFVAYGRGASRFHGSGANPGLRESVAFHVRLPPLRLPELRRRGVARGAAIIMLVVVWEAANLAGFLAHAMR